MHTIALIPLLVGLAQAAATSQQRPYLAQAQPNPLISADEVITRGRDHLGRDVEVATSVDNGLRVEVKSRGKSFGNIELLSSRYKSPQITRLLIETDKEGRVIVRIPFGDARPECYINYDGRDVIIITFQYRKNPDVETQSYENCGVEKG